MSEVKSNIELYYEQQVAFAVETAITCIDSDGDDEETALQYAIDNAFYTYGSDQAYVLAHAFMQGYIRWGGEIDWDAINEMINDDVYNELQRERSKNE